MKKNSNTSYNQIIKSTSIFGASQILVIIIGILRTKIIAVLLGPSGIGIIGIYQSIIDMVRMGSGLGIDTGGIREIAKAERSEDAYHLNRTVSIFSHWFVGTALLGLLACIVFSYPISIWAFGNADYILPIIFLSVCVCLGALTTGKSVVLQGFRKISYMAKASVWGSFLSLIIAVPLYYFLRFDGILLAFVTASLVMYFCTDYYCRRLDVEYVHISRREAWMAGLETLRFGLYVVAAGVVNTGSMFLIRAFLTRSIDLDAAGLYQSAWTISTVYLGLLLKSMGSDFFPRLSSIADNEVELKKLVNEQTYIILIISSPLIIGMLLFSDIALSMLYSSKFDAANSLLQWQITASFVKVISWPIAFVMLVKNKGFLFLLSEILFYGVYILSSYFLFSEYGLDALGIGYLIAYVIYFPAVYIIGYFISGFNWSANITGMVFVNLALICSVFYIVQHQSHLILALGSILLLLALLYAYIKLRQVFSLEDLKNWFKKMR